GWVVRVLVVAGGGGEVRFGAAPGRVEVAHVRGERPHLVLVVAETEHAAGVRAVDQAGGVVVLTVRRRARPVRCVLAGDVARGRDDEPRRPDGGRLGGVTGCHAWVLLGVGAV